MTTQAVWAYLSQSRDEFILNKRDVTDPHMLMLGELGPTVFNQSLNKRTTQLGIVPYYHTTNGGTWTRIFSTWLAWRSGEMSLRADWDPVDLGKKETDVSADFNGKITELSNAYRNAVDAEVANYKAIEYRGYCEKLEAKIAADAQYKAYFSNGTNGVRVLRAQTPGLRSMMATKDGIVSVYESGGDHGYGKILSRKIATGPGEMVGAALNLCNVASGLRKRADVMMKIMTSSGAQEVHTRRAPVWSAATEWRMKNTVHDMEQLLLTEENRTKVLTMFPSLEDFKSKKMTTDQLYELVTKLTETVQMYAAKHGKDSAAAKMLKQLEKDGTLQVKPEMGLPKDEAKDKTQFSPKCQLCGDNLIKDAKKGKKCRCGGDAKKAAEVKKDAVDADGAAADGPNKPRLIFNVGAYAQILSIVPVGIMELLYYSELRTGEASDGLMNQKDKFRTKGFYNPCHIKHAGKKKAMRYFCSRCKNLPDVCFSEGDGSNFDWTVGERLLTFENGLLNSILEWAVEGAWGNFLPGEAIEALKIAHNTSRSQSEQTMTGGTNDSGENHDHRKNRGGWSCYNRTLMKIDYSLCRKSGDRGTSCLNHFVNWLLWGTLLLSDALDMFRPEIQDDWMRSGISLSDVGTLRMTSSGKPIKTVMSSWGKRNIGTIIGAHVLKSGGTALAKALEDELGSCERTEDKVSTSMRALWSSGVVQLEIKLRAIFEGDDSLLGHCLRLKYEADGVTEYLPVPRRVTAQIIKRIADEWFGDAGMNMKIIQAHSEYSSVREAASYDKVKAIASAPEVVTFAGINMLAHSTGLYNAAVPETVRGLNGVQWSTSPALLATAPGSSAEADIAYGAIMARVAATPAVGYGKMLRAWYTACAAEYAANGADTTTLTTDNDMARKLGVEAGVKVNLLDFLNASEEESLRYDDREAVDRVITLTAGVVTPEEEAVMLNVSGLMRTTNAVPFLPRAWCAEMCRTAIEMV